MLFVKRTRFNELFQRHRIGAKKFSRHAAFKRVVARSLHKRTLMQKTRRSHQGRANQVYGRITLVKVRIKYYIKSKIRSYPNKNSVFLRRFK